LEASIGNRPSLAWRSIWNANELLQQGLFWRVGDGRQIKVWADRWLLTPPIYKSNTLLGGLDRNSVVASLKYQGTKGWNLDLIKKVFSEDEGHAISNNPLSPLLPQD